MPEKFFKYFCGTIHPQNHPQLPSNNCCDYYGAPMHKVAKAIGFKVSDINPEWMKINIKTLKDNQSLSFANIDFLKNSDPDYYRSIFPFSFVIFTYEYLLRSFNYDKGLDDFFYGIQLDANPNYNGDEERTVQRYTHQSLSRALLAIIYAHHTKQGIKLPNKYDINVLNRYFSYKSGKIIFYDQPFNETNLKTVLNNNLKKFLTPENSRMNVAQRNKDKLLSATERDKLGVINNQETVAHLFFESPFYEIFHAPKFSKFHSTLNFNAREPHVVYSSKKLTSGVLTSDMLIIQLLHDMTHNTSPMNSHPDNLSDDYLQLEKIEEELSAFASTVDDNIISWGRTVRLAPATNTRMVYDMAELEHWAVPDNDLFFSQYTANIKLPEKVSHWELIRLGGYCFDPTVYVSCDIIDHSDDGLSITVGLDRHNIEAHQLQNEKRYAALRYNEDSQIIELVIIFKKSFDF